MIKILQGINKYLHKEKIIGLLIPILLLPLYLFKLSLLPTSVHGDEGETALWALNIIKGNVGLTGTGWFDLPLLSFLPHGIFMFWLGSNIVADRLGSVIFGILTLPIFYILLKDLFDKRIALTSTILLGTSHLWLALSRLGVTYVQSTFFIVCVLFILYKAFKTNNKIYFVLGGLTLGLSLYSNFAVRIILFLAPVIFIYYLLKKISIKEKFSNLILFLISALIIFLPQGIFYLDHPGKISSRENSIFVFSERAKQWTNYKNLDNTRIFLEQTKRTFNVFAGDNSTQYGYKGKLLDYFSIFFFFVGLAYALIKMRMFRYQLMLIWLLLAILAQIFTSIPPPIFLPRFVVGLPVLYFFIGFGIILTINILHKELGINKYYSDFIILIIILLFFFYNFSVYFINYPKQIAGDPNARAATNIALVLNKDYKNYTAYFYTAPYLYADFGTLRFLANDINRINIKDSQEIILGEKNSIYIIYPMYDYLTKRLKSYFPFGIINEFKEINGYTQFYTFTP